MEKIKEFTVELPEKIDDERTHIVWSISFEGKSALGLDRYFIFGSPSYIDSFYQGVPLWCHNLGYGCPHLHYNNIEGMSQEELIEYIEKALPMLSAQFKTGQTHDQRTIAVTNAWVDYLFPKED